MFHAMEVVGLAEKPAYREGLGGWALAVAAQGVLCGLAV